jgi:hypothetical protein
MIVLINPILVADKPDTVQSRFIRSVLEDCVISLCASCGTALQVPPCAQKNQVGTSPVHCMPCARRLHPDAWVKILVTCKDERNKLKAKAEMN